MQAEVGWRRPARLRNVRWLESSGKESRELATIESIRTSQSLWDIARGREFEATVDRPTILGATDVDGDPCILKVIEVLDPLYPIGEYIGFLVRLMSGMWSVQ